MAALRAMRRVLRTEADPLTGYGPSSRLLRAATQAIHSNYISIGNAANNGQPDVHSPTPCRTTVALNDDQPRQHGDYIFIGNSAIDGQPDYYDGNADYCNASSGNYNN